MLGPAVAPRAPRGCTETPQPHSWCSGGSVATHVLQSITWTGPARLWSLVKGSRRREDVSARGWDHIHLPLVLAAKTERGDSGVALRCDILLPP